jgi:hypothetical protein
MIFCHGLRHVLLEQGERVECDDGYKGEDPRLVKTPGGVRYCETADVHCVRGDARACHETVNHVLKHFQVLSGMFRH